VRALNNEPALLFSGIFGVGVLAFPLIGQWTGVLKFDEGSAVSWARVPRTCARIDEMLAVFPQVRRAPQADGV
jgi:hypothetical protein